MVAYRAPRDPSESKPVCYERLQIPGGAAVKNRVDGRFKVLRAAEGNFQF